MEGNLTLRLSFLGGAGTVTGSKFLVERSDRRLLVDCGLFQGFKTLRLRNWARFPVDPRQIDAVILTHAHLDHTGYLPLLVKRGFTGPVFCSESTAEFCRILLPDSGYLQEKDADYANRHGFSKHKPALPLYTYEDAVTAIDRLEVIAFDQPQGLPGGATALLRRAGHILGAGSVQLDWAGTRIVFSGDLGRYGDPIMVDPASIEDTDYLLVEFDLRRPPPQPARSGRCPERSHPRDCWPGRDRCDPRIRCRPRSEPTVSSPSSEGQRAPGKRSRFPRQSHGGRCQ